MTFDIDFFIWRPVQRKRGASRHWIGVCKEAFTKETLLDVLGAYIDIKGKTETRMFYYWTRKDDRFIYLDSNRKIEVQFLIIQ